MTDAKTLVKLLAWIYVVLAGFGLVSSIALMFAGPAMISVGLLGEGAARMAGMMGGAMTFFGLVMVLVHVFLIWAAFQLMAFKHWARVGFLVIGALSLLSVPIGTVIGIFAIWLLGFHEEARSLFE